MLVSHYIFTIISQHIYIYTKFNNFNKCTILLFKETITQSVDEVQPWFEMKT